MRGLGIALIVIGCLGLACAVAFLVSIPIQLTGVEDASERSWITTTYGIAALIEGAFGAGALLGGVWMVRGRRRKKGRLRPKKHRPPEPAEDAAPHQRSDEPFTAVEIDWHSAPPSLRTPPPPGPPPPVRTTPPPTASRRGRILVCFCGRELFVPAEFAGLKVTCPSCGQAFAVEPPKNKPAATTPPASPMNPSEPVEDSPTDAKAEKRIRFRCPHCHLPLRSPREDKRSRCPGCGEVVWAPGKRSRLAAQTRGRLQRLLDQEPSAIASWDLTEEADGLAIESLPQWQRFLRLAERAQRSGNDRHVRTARRFLKTIRCNLASQNTWVWVWRGLLSLAHAGPAPARTIWVSGLMHCPHRSLLAQYLGLSYLEDGELVRGTAWLVLAVRLVSQRPELSAGENLPWLWLAHVAEAARCPQLARSLFNEADLRRPDRLPSAKCRALAESFHRLLPDERDRFKEVLRILVRRVPLLPADALPEEASTRQEVLDQLRSRPAAERFSPNLRVRLPDDAVAVPREDWLTSPIPLASESAPAEASPLLPDDAEILPLEKDTNQPPAASSGTCERCGRFSDLVPVTTSQHFPVGSQDTIRVCRTCALELSRSGG